MTGFPGTTSFTTLEGKSATTVSTLLPAWKVTHLSLKSQLMIFKPSWRSCWIPRILLNSSFYSEFLLKSQDRTTMITIPRPKMVTNSKTTSLFTSFPMSKKLLSSLHLTLHHAFIQSLTISLWRLKTHTGSHGPLISMSLMMKATM